jgi:3-phenylpropionate/trans-cinnamate dioxygenase ferredoxin reductase component
MATHESFVLIGAGLAGVKAAETLREEGFDGRIHPVGDEPERPYERPPLSKGVLLGDAERDSVFVHDEGWCAEHDVDLRTGAAAVALHLGDPDAPLGVLVG